MMNKLITGDCVVQMSKLPPASVDLVFADPPFNIGYSYDVYQDRRAKMDYLAWVAKWLSHAKCVLKPTGTIMVAIGDEFAAEYKIALDALQLSMRNWIVWHYTFGVHTSKKFSRSHVHILYYVADAKRFTFNADAVRVPSARQTTYGDARAVAGGRLPDDTWVLRPQEPGSHFHGQCDSWFAPRICGTFKERTGHPCQMPEAILERIIRVASNPGDVVLDPFAGSGTTLAVAKRLGRRWIGFELSPKYASAARARIRKTQQGADDDKAKRSPRT